MSIGLTAISSMAILLAFATAAPDEPAREVAAPGQASLQNHVGPAAVDEFDLAKRRRDHWAWQPISTQRPPSVRSTAWASDPIDQFVLAGLENRGIAPALAADERMLIRRVYFDLIGLPPAPAEVEAFLRDPTANSFERIVDRLLSSPQFGERWGRHWLDLVRYAETRGHEFDHIIPNAYQYRDYVIRAFNADLPYDQFVTEHIAGDLTEQPRLHATEGFNESVLGTGFWFLGEELHSPVDIRGDETDRIDNKIDVYSKAFLGLTVSCARCHDHKFDAISMRDYYGLTGFLLSSSYRQVPFESMEHNRRLAQELEALEAKFRPAIVRAIADAQRAGAMRVSEYLLAARSAIQMKAEAGDHNESTVIGEIAAEQRLDASRLRPWIEELERAIGDPENPLHLWSLVAHAKVDGLDYQRTMTRLLDEGKQSQGQVEKSWHDVRRIVDFSVPAAEDWSQDGLVFGARPVRPGDVSFSADPVQPIAEVCRFAGARSDPTWDTHLAPGTERDPGKVAWSQAGRTLRTRTFTLSTGKLFYLVRGAGHAYAAVDSHRLIAGPLHAALTRTWEAEPAGKLRWVEHDLSSYRGHRAHIELSPKEPDPKKQGALDELLILSIVEADRVPSDPVPCTVSLLQKLGELNCNSPNSLARAYEAIISETLEQFGADRLVGSRDAEISAWLAIWMIQHPQLFVADEVEMARQIAQAAGPFFEQVAAIKGRIRRVSRTAPALLDGSGVDEYVLNRGNHRTPGALVPRRFLEALGITGAQEDQAHVESVRAEALDRSIANRLPDEFDCAVRVENVSGSGRLRLARQMTDPLNPLVARVLVNRVWHHLFGRGIVASVDNVGMLGERPTHPELLDYLARRFITQGWSMKRLIRQIVLSSTYQMSANAQPVALATDPQNLLLHCMPVRRLEGEVIRDAILAVSGRLDTAMFGPSVELHLTSFMEGRGRPTASGPLDGDGRRSIYLRVRRNFLHPMLTAFDAPTPFTTIGRRSISNVPAQALSLMNNEFVIAEAKRWAHRVISEDVIPADRARRMFLAAFGRACTEDELDEALQFVSEQQERYDHTGDTDPRPWEDLAHVLLNAKEFIFIQ